MCYTGVRQFGQCLLRRGIYTQASQSCAKDVQATLLQDVRLPSQTCCPRKSSPCPPRWPRASNNNTTVAPRHFSTCRPHRPVSRRVPAGAWDSHIHVIDPVKFPLSPDATYTPETYTLQDALAFESSVGIDHVVLVQPSIYSHDNSCLLRALQQLGPRRGRGVVSFDPSSSDSTQLSGWDATGVRGVRLNVSSNCQTAQPEKIQQRLEQLAEAIRPFDWVLQLYVPMSLIERLEDGLPKLGVRICFDHLGHPDMEARQLGDPYSIPGFAALVRLMQCGHAFVKLSAPYRLGQSVGQHDIESISKEVIRLGGMDRVVFATDWPHTRHEGYDIEPWMNQVLDWCEDDALLLQRLFKGNAEALWNPR